MKTILLIEDDLALRENTAELLELSKYVVLSAPNGKVGIEKALQHVPDIIVLRYNDAGDRWIWCFGKSIVQRTNKAYPIYISLCENGT